MNYRGVDMYAHNRATRRYGTTTAADLTPAQPVDCPFCGKATMSRGGMLAEHSERYWPGRCPAAGHSIDEALRMEQRLTADYRLPSEGDLE